MSSQPFDIHFGRGRCTCSPQRAGNPDQPELAEHAGACPYLKIGSTIVLLVNEVETIMPAELARQYADDGVVWSHPSLRETHYSDQEPS